MAINERKQQWYENKALTPEKIALARLILADVTNGQDMNSVLRAHPLPTGGFVGKSILVAAYNEMVAQGEITPANDLL